MENQDTFFEKIKSAAQNSESQDFAAMEKVWQRVEDKLDNKVLKTEKKLWKKWAIAASILLGLSIGYHYLNQDVLPVNSKETITEKEANSNQEQLKNSQERITKSTILKDDAEKMLKQKDNNQNIVAYENSKGENDRITFDSMATESGSSYSKTSITEPVSTPIKEDEKSKDVELFIGKENKIDNSQKNRPLLVIDDKVNNKQSLGKINLDDVENIIELKEPLYIINGIYYTEQELFGPNPTSPYAPLTDQKIETISILQDEKAISIYGEKGKKGVVIITTKNGKPAAKKDN